MNLWVTVPIGSVLGHIDEEKLLSLNWLSARFDWVGIMRYYFVLLYEIKFLSNLWDED